MIEANTGTEQGPANTDPANTGTEQGPANTDPANTDPANTDPANTDPANTDPANTDPANTDPATSAKAAAKIKYYYYDNETGEFYIGVPQRDLTEEEVAALPDWLQKSLDKSNLYQTKRRK